MQQLACGYQVAVADRIPEQIAAAPETCACSGPAQSDPGSTWLIPARDTDGCVMVEVADDRSSPARVDRICVEKSISAALPSVFHGGAADTDQALLVSDVAGSGRDLAGEAGKSTLCKRSSGVFRRAVDWMETAVAVGGATVSLLRDLWAHPSLIGDSTILHISSQQLAALQEVRACTDSAGI